MDTKRETPKIPDFMKRDIMSYSEYINKSKSNEEIVAEIMRLNNLLQQRKATPSKRNDYVNDVKESQYNYLKQLNQYNN